MVSVWAWPSRRQRRPWSSTGQLIIYKGPTVRRSTAARTSSGGFWLGWAGRARRCPTSSGTLYSLPGRRSPTCGACSLGCGASKFVVFRLSRSHRKYLYQVPIKVPRYHGAAIKLCSACSTYLLLIVSVSTLLLLAQNQVLQHWQRHHSSPSKSALRKATSSVNASRSNTQPCASYARKPRGRRCTSTR